MKPNWSVIAAAATGLVSAIAMFFFLGLWAWTAIHSEWWHAHQNALALVLVVVPVAVGVLAAVATHGAIKNTRGE